MQALFVEQYQSTRKHEALEAKTPTLPSGLRRPRLDNSSTLRMAYVLAVGGTILLEIGLMRDRMILLGASLIADACYLVRGSNNASKKQ